MKTRIFTLFFFCIGTVYSSFAAFPYAVTVNTKTYDALPSGTATHVLAAANATLTPTTVPIGFNFRFFGQMQDKVTINQNGQISFTNFVFPDFIDAICATLQPTATSQIAYGTINTTPSRVFIIEWKNMNIKNAKSTSANTTFHIELFETTGGVSMSYSQGPAANDENWYDGDQYGLVQEFKNIQGDFDLIFGKNLTAPQVINVAGSLALRYGYGNSFPAPGTEYAFNYVKPAGAPITILSPKTGQLFGHKPLLFSWTSTTADSVKIITNYGGGPHTIATVLSGKTPYSWDPSPFNTVDFDLTIQDAKTPADQATVKNLKYDFSGINPVNIRSLSLKIYPNPCKGAATIDLSEYNGDLSNSKIFVSNMLGQIVYSNTFNHSSQNDLIELSGLGKGLYIVNLQVGDQRYTEKLIVE